MYCVTLLYIVKVKNNYADTMRGLNKQPDKRKEHCVEFLLLIEMFIDRV